MRRGVHCRRRTRVRRGDHVAARDRRGLRIRPERGDLRILHQRVVGDDANVAVALHDDEVFALRRTQVAENVQIVVHRRRTRAGKNSTTEQCY
jgi:hypothetical protein